MHEKDSIKVIKSFCSTDMVTKCERKEDDFFIIDCFTGTDKAFERTHTIFTDCHENDEISVKSYIGEGTEDNKFLKSLFIENLYLGYFSRISIFDDRFYSSARIPIRALSELFIYSSIAEVARLADIINLGYYHGVDIYTGGPHYI